MQHQPYPTRNRRNFFGSTSGLTDMLDTGESCGPFGLPVMHSESALCRSSAPDARPIARRAGIGRAYIPSAFASVGMFPTAASDADSSGRELHVEAALLGIKTLKQVARAKVN